MSKKQLFKDVIAHWERMLDYAKKQDLNEHCTRSVMIEKMRVDLGEVWFASDCAFCIKYFKSKCRKCPLYENKFKCNRVGSLWRKVDTANNWKDWIYYAENLLSVIKDLYEKEYHNGKTM